MNLLSCILMAKIVITVVFVVWPFMTRDRQALERLTGVAAPSVTLFRLYGLALLALLFTYGFGLIEAWFGIFPTGAVVVGLISNGGATQILLSTGASPAMRRGAPVFGGITAALGLCFVAPGLALAPWL